MDHLPMGAVFDQIACWQIANGAEERKAASGSLMSQMAQYFAG